MRFVATRQILDDFTAALGEAAAAESAGGAPEAADQRPTATAETTADQLQTAAASAAPVSD